jgi:hypothetical protein
VRPSYFFGFHIVVPSEDVWRMHGGWLTQASRGATKTIFRKFSGTIDIRDDQRPTEESRHV